MLQWINALYTINSLLLGWFPQRVSINPKAMPTNDTNYIIAIQQL